MKKLLLLGFILVVSSTTLVKAQEGVKSNSARQVTQQARIADGVNDKQLTRHETARLEREQRKIQIEKKMAKADGTVTPKEKRFLRHEQNRASRDIKRQKNDGQTRK
jgi:hypothetical protein